MAFTNTRGYSIRQSVETPQKTSVPGLKSLVGEKPLMSILNPMIDSVPMCFRRSVKPFQTSGWTSISIGFYKVGQKMVNKICKDFRHQ